MESVLFVVVSCALFETGLSELCYTDFLQSKYCAYGCCGHRYSQYCCAYDFSLYIGLGVTGSIIFTVCVVGVIIYLCSRHNRPGRVINAANTTQPGVATVTHYSSAGGAIQTQTSMYNQPPVYLYPPASYPVDPTGYPQQAPAGYPPPGYSGTGVHPPQTGPLPPGYASVGTKQYM